MKKPIFSVLIPTHNRSKYLVEALDSALNQTFKDFEIIISDNASTDDTAKIVKKYLKKNRNIRYYRQKKDLGSINNISFLIEKIRTPYAVFLFDDDLIDKEFLKKANDVLKKDRSLKYIYLSGTWINDKSEIIMKIKSTNKITILERYALLKKNYHLGINTAVFKAEGIKIGDNSLAGDIIFALRLSMKGKGALVDYVGYFYRAHENNESNLKDLFEKSVNAFDSLKDIYFSIDKDIRDEFEKNILNQKYLLFLSSITYNLIISLNFRKYFQRLKLLHSKTKFFKIRMSSILIFIKSFHKTAKGFVLYKLGK